MRRIAWAGGLLLGMGLLLSGRPTDAAITRLTPLKGMIEAGQFVFVAKVEAVDPDKPSVVLTVEEDLKGKAPFRRLPINLTGDSEAKKEKHTPQLLKRLAPKLPVIILVCRDDKADKRYFAFGYTNGTWFQILGHQGEQPETVRWSLAHAEPYLRRTFKGTTVELKQTVTDALAGKKQPPEPDPKEKPGLGPEVTTPDAALPPAAKQARAEGGPLFAVIPTLGIGGPLALLALLFPTVFGGATGQLRRWTAFLTVSGLTSTLYLAHSWYYASIMHAWWSRPLILWLAMALISAAGLVWAWRRARAGLPVSGRIEIIVLAVLSLGGLVPLGYYAWSEQSLLGPESKMLLVLCVGLWAGTVYRLAWRPRPNTSGPATELVMVGGMLLATVGLLPTVWQGPAEADERVSVAWVFTSPDGNGRIASSPLVWGEHVYAAAAIDHAFHPRGVVYCLDRKTGQLVWKFDDDGELKQVFSSPCIADGRLYIGEGFHQDSECKLYCLDAATGKKLWDFKTESHTESSPVVADGKVYFGAGDDGLYCLGARSGEKRWHFRGPHVDMRPTVIGNKVFAGSGYGMYEVFCLDAGTGEVVWRKRTDLPVFSSPEFDHSRLVFCGVGNGNFVTSDDRPAGAVLCFDADTGKEIWRCDVPDAVHAQPRYHRDSVYFVSRDRYLYSVSALSGKVWWQKDLGSPVVATPRPFHTTSWDAWLCVVTSEGRITVMDISEGQPTVGWELELSRHAQAPVQVLSSPCVDAWGQGEYRIYFGAELRTGVGGVAALYCLETRRGGSQR